MVTATKKSCLALASQKMLVRFFFTHILLSFLKIFVVLNG
jgi:hypothetical protein